MSIMQKLLDNELTHALQQATKQIAKSATLSDAPNPLINPQAKITKREQEATAAFEKLCTDYLEGAKALSSTLPLLAETYPDINSAKVSQELMHISEKMQQSPKSSYQLSEETLNALFIVSNHLLSERQFDKATKAFLLLCTLSPNDYDLWIGLGHSAFQNKQFDTAIMAYYGASSLRNNTPWPLVWTANACEQLKDHEGAVHLLTRAYELAQADPEMDSLAREIQKRLKKNHKGDQ